METRANYVIVGLFTVLAVLAAFLFVYWQSDAGNTKDQVPVEFRIDGSASGLARGSLVMFNGVRVGTIQDVKIDPEDPARSIAFAMIDKASPITPSTKAVVGIAGLTGTANIELSGGSKTEPKILEQPHDGPAQIETSSSAVTNLLQTAQDILSRANNVVSQLEQFTTEAREPLTQSARDVQTFTSALAKNSEGVDKFLASTSALAEQLTGMSGKLDTTIETVNKVVAAVDEKKISTIINNAQSFSQNATDASKRFDSVISKVDELLGDKNTKETIAQAGDTLRSYREFADQLNKRFGPIADDVTKTLASYRQVADNLNTKVAPLADNFNSTLASYRQVAVTLNAKLTPIANNLEKFSSQGLRDAQALINDARRSVTRIEQAVTDLERNPQRIITGGEGEVRRFNGRNRR